VSQTLDSCLAQTWANKEVIAVNDGSKDRSLAVLRHFESRGVVVIDKPNGGASSARNAGLRVARGEFVQFLDADDLLAPDKIERQVSFFNGHPEARLISGEWTRFTTEPSAALFTQQPNWKEMSGPEFLQLYFETGAMMHPAAWLARRSLLDESRAGRIFFCSGALSFYRSDLPGSLSGRSDPKSLASLYRSFELTLGHLKKADSSPRTLAAIADGWKWLAFELYPGRPDLANQAEARARELGGGNRRLPGGGRFQAASRFLGWRLAKRLCS